jgi:hypothetical protein
VKRIILRVLIWLIHGLFLQNEKRCLPLDNFL